MSRAPSSSQVTASSVPRQTTSLPLLSPQGRRAAFGALSAVQAPSRPGDCPRSVIGMGRRLPQRRALSPHAPTCCAVGRYPHRMSRARACLTRAGRALPSADRRRRTTPPSMGSTPSRCALRRRPHPLTHPPTHDVDGGVQQQPTAGFLSPPRPARVSACGRRRRSRPGCATPASRSARASSAPPATSTLS